MNKFTISMNITLDSCPQGYRYSRVLHVTFSTSICAGCNEWDVMFWHMWQYD